MPKTPHTMTHPWTDVSSDPIFVVHFPTTATKEEVAVWIEDIDRFYANNEHPFGWIIDCLQIGSTLAAHRKMTGEHHQRNHDHLKQYCFGIAYAINNPLVRGMLTAVYWFAPPCHPYRVFSTVAECRRWVEQQRTHFRFGANL